jgi:hypothetical protein
MFRVQLCRGTYHFGLEWGLHLSPLQSRPVYRLEEAVQPNVPNHAQPLTDVSFKQLEKDTNQTMLFVDSSIPATKVF